MVKGLKKKDGESLDLGEEGGIKRLQYRAWANGSSSDGKVGRKLAG